jgi:hypothetical protein
LTAKQKRKEQTENERKQTMNEEWIGREEKREREETREEERADIRHDSVGDAHV